MVRRTGLFIQTMEMAASAMKTLAEAYRSNSLDAPPDWLIAIVKARPQVKASDAAPIAGASIGKGERAYAAKALESEAAKVAATLPTKRNIELNNAALKLGHMIGAGWIGRHTVEGALYDAAIANGEVKDDGERAVKDTIKSGIEAGISEPHAPLPDRPLPPKGSGKVTGAESTVEKEKPSVHDWDDPDWSILDDRRGVLPEFPIEIFSQKMQELIKRTSKGAGVTHAHVAVPLIGIVSSLIGTARRIKATSSWLQCTTCWAVIVGFSGTGKTPGINVTKRALNMLERNSKTADDERRRKHETKKEGADATRKRWQQSVKDAVETGMPAPPMPAGADDPGKFIPVKLWVADGTIERLADLLSARPQGVLVLRDELSALFTNMSRYSGGQDNEFWLEAWNGDAFNQERMGRMVSADHLLIGVVGGMQPDKLATSFEGDHDGMYARVLFSWPPEPSYSPLSNDAQEIDTDILNIVSRVNTLAEFTAEGTLVIREIPLSDEAWNEFEQFVQFVHKGKAAFEGREREWFAKMTAHALRLAGAITFLEWALTIEPTKPTAITKDTMASAIKMVRDFFWPHARACLRQIGLTERHANARKVLRWLRANPSVEEISIKDIRRDALGQTLDATQTEALLDGLAGAGWLRRKPAEQTGGRPVHRWLVNPDLFSNPSAQSAESAERG
jgi:Protein of unknown function (DUF3987)